MTVAILCIVGIALLAALWQWQRTERPRLAARMASAEAGARRMQQDVTEVERLRARPVLAPISGPALAEAANNSLKSRNLRLDVTPLGADRLRVQGNAGFDETIAWIGSMQRDYRLSLVSMNATRQGGTAQIEAVLAAVSH